MLLLIQKNKQEGKYNFVNLAVAGINAAITNHFVMLFRDMAVQTLYKFHTGVSFLHVFVILMAVVMESNINTIIDVNTGSGDYRLSKIGPDILQGNLGSHSLTYHNEDNTK